MLVLKNNTSLFSFINYIYIYFILVLINLTDIIKIEKDDCEIFK